MLHILLLILKIIGIVLLCILGILILGIVCMLFVPVRYRIEAMRQEGEGKPPVELRIKVTWLLHFVNVLFRFDESLFLRARLSFFTVFRLPKRKKEGAAKKETQIETKRGRRSKKKQEEEETAGTELSGAAFEAAKETGGENEAADDRAQAQGAEEEQTSGGEEEGDSEEQPSFFQKLRAVPKIIRDIFVKIKSLFINIQYTFQKFCDKISSALRKMAYYREILEGEPFRRSFVLCKGELAAIGKSLKPDRFEAKLIVGLDDPAATGEVLAVCGMLYPLLGGHVDVTGDFEEKRLEGRIFIKGKVRFFTFLRVAVKIYFNKDIKKLVKLLKKEAA